MGVLSPRNAIPLVLLWLSGNDALAQCSSTPGYNSALEARLYKNFVCFQPGVDGFEATQRAACNAFAAMAIRAEWGFNDFWLESKKRFMTTSEMLVWLASPQGGKSWTSLGAASDQASHEMAADSASKGQPVIALYYDGGSTGHVALVLPGQLMQSSTWGMPVARIAQSQIDSGDGAFVGCPLSQGFSAKKKEKVKFFARRMF